MLTSVLRHLLLRSTDRSGGRGSSDVLFERAVGDRKAVPFREIGHRFDAETRAYVGGVAITERRRNPIYFTFLTRVPLCGVPKT